MNLGRVATRGAAFLSGANLLAYAISFTSTLVLARELGPTDFGKVVFAIAVAEFMFLVGAWSLPIALIREPEDTAREAFDTALALLAGIGAVLLLVSAPVAFGLWKLESLEIGIVFYAIVGGRVVALLGGWFVADLERRFAYGRFSLIQLASVVAAAVLAVALARAGAGMWALASRDIGVSVAGFALAAVFSHRWPGRSFSLRKARELMVFGAQMLGSRLGEMLFHRYDNMVVGVVSGARQLGLYNQAYILTETGNKLYGPVLQQLPMATYARIQGDRERTSHAFSMVTFFLTRAVAPLAALFLVLPGELLSVLFGERWREAANMLRWLSVYALILPLFDHMRVLLVANGALRQVLVTRVVQLAFFLPATAIAVALWGGVGASVAVAGGMVIGFACIVRYARRFVIIAAQDFAPPLAAAAVATALAAVARGSAEGDFQRLLVAGGTLTVAYALALAALDNVRLLERARAVTLRLWPAAEDVEVSTGTALAAVASSPARAGQRP